MAWKVWNTSVEWIHAASYLQLYWFIQSAMFLLVLLYCSVTGSVWDKSQGLRKPEDRLGWFEFRKRRPIVFSLALIWLIYLCLTVIGSYCFGFPPRPRFEHFNSVVNTSAVSTDVLCTLIGLLMYTVHVGRRLYECLWVSIFSGTRVYGPIRLVRDYIYYIAAGLTVISESPQLLQHSTSCLSLYGSVRWFHPVALVMFIAATKIHYTTHQQFARLRRNKSGHIVTTGYKLPKDGWFDRLNVSCPHYFAEILVYASIGLALGAQNTTWWMLTAYVFLHHHYLAYNKRAFYRLKFDDYPAQRKMFLPFLI